MLSADFVGLVEVFVGFGEVDDSFDKADDAGNEGWKDEKPP